MPHTRPDRRKLRQMTARIRAERPRYVVLRRSDNAELGDTTDFDTAARIADRSNAKGVPAGVHMYHVRSNR